MRRPRLLVLVDLVQDVDALLPILLALKADGQIDLGICVSRWLERESPRTDRLLKAHGLAFSYLRRREVVEGRRPSLRGVDGVLAASESSHPAHAAGHALARRAKAAGLKTYTVQHGFENVGLFGIEAASATFGSDCLFCWFAPEATPPDLPAATRAKLAHVGRPAPPGGWRRGLDPAFDLGVFENLHWDRYSESDRQAFGEGLLAVAHRLPACRILVRPHPAGAWADRLGHELAQFGNISALRAANARDNPEGAAELMQKVRRVITTPSTVALDAALSGTPVALAVDGGSVYRPLRVLTDPAGWVAFASDEAPAAGLDQFVSHVLVAGDGTPRILQRLTRDLVGRTR